MLCYENGATILHYHARRQDGSPDNSREANSEIIRRVKKECDILIHPTLGFNANDDLPRERIDAIAKLCESSETRPDIVPIAPGSVNIECYDSKAKTVANEHVVYLNSTETIMYAAEVFSKLDLSVQFFCWGVTFVRRGKMLMDLGLLKYPPYFVFHLTTGAKISCNPPTKLGLDSMLEMMPQNPTSPWAVACGGGSLIPLIPYIAQSGGHVCIGLGDYSYDELESPTNAKLVAMTAQIARENGREIATLAQTKEILGIK